MAYDEFLADRVRTLLRDRATATEKRMFGGLAFLVGGHMAVAASREGGLLVRIDPAEGDALRALPGTRPMVKQGREMDGWLRVDSDAVDEDAGLIEWVDRSLAYVRTLPPKR